MKETSTFQIIILVVFVAFIILGVFLFSSRGGKSGGEFLGNIVVWGTLPENTVSGIIKNIYAKEETVSIKYEEKREATFDRDLVEALASGVGPDVILLPQSLIVRHRDKAYPIPPESLSARDFKNRFIEEGEMYITEDGILALPFTVDPLVMYWNRDMFTSAGVVSPPVSWEEFYTLVPRLTVRGGDSNIIRSAISFGEFRNVTNAKEIISLLILQAGNAIVERSPARESGYRSVLYDTAEGAPSADAALRFYTEFSNPAKPSYSWNRSLPNSRDMFVAGDLAMYIGFASENADLKKRNPHLNFDVAEVPQALDAKRKTTFGNMQGLAILKTTKNIGGAFRAAILLSDRDFNSRLSETLGLPPVRRDLLSKKPGDEDLSLFYDAALVSRAWPDPSPDDTLNIFRGMVEAIVSGRSKVSAAVSAASGEIDQLLK